MTDGAFLPGQALARQLYDEAVRPLMDAHAAGLPYGAAFIGAGSDVLGYDTARSMDHDWGPRLTLFIPDDMSEKWVPRLEKMFLSELPERIAGFPTRFQEFANDPGIMHMAGGDGEGPLLHRIRITSAPAFLNETLGVRSMEDFDVPTWLTVPEQTLLELTAGVVFRDESGAIEAFRNRLAWYPKDIWRYRLAAAWKRIAQIEPFIGRAAEVDDDLGSQVIAVSLIRDVMRLALLQERRYAPYSKWLGTAFARIDIAAPLQRHLDAARFARSWLEREHQIVQAVAMLAERQNHLALCKHVDPTPRPFFSRPFTVIDAERFADALTQSIEAPEVKVMPLHLGGIDQYIDSTDALVNPEVRVMLRDWLRSR